MPPEHPLIDFSDRAADPATLSPSIRINMPTLDRLLAAVEARLSRREGFALATVNLDHVVKMRRDPRFRAAYAQHELVVADGNPLVWAAGLAGTAVSLLPGSELIAPLCALAARMGVTVAVVGATDETLALAAERLEAAHPGLRIVLRLAPSFGFDPRGPGADSTLDAIGSCGAGLCFLALGSPKQETLAARGRSRAPQCGFVSIGAGLDFIAGTQRRAPRWVRRLALEWLWRAATNPRRLARRYADCLAVLPALLGMAVSARRHNRM